MKEELDSIGLTHQQKYTFRATSRINGYRKLSFKFTSCTCPTYTVELPGNKRVENAIL
jgi:hypothetical protein